MHGSCGVVVDEFDIGDTANVGAIANDELTVARREDFEITGVGSRHSDHLALLAEEDGIRVERPICLDDGEDKARFAPVDESRFGLRFCAAKVAAFDIEGPKAVKFWIQLLLLGLNRKSQ